MDFLLVLIELVSLGVAAEVLRAKIDRKLAILLQHGQFDPKFQVQGVAPTNHFCTNSQARECLTTLSLLLVSNATLRENVTFSRFSFALLIMSICVKL